MPATRLWLVRHGQTDWNLNARIQGHTPTGLNAPGRAQAAALAAWFAGKPFAALYSSDLPRTAETAAPIAAALHLTITTTPLLRERALGPYEGLYEHEAAKLRHTAGVPSAQGDLADWSNVPDVESDAALWARCDTIFRQIAAAHTSEDVLIVTHGGVLNRTIQQALGLTNQPRRYSLANGIIAVFEYRNEAPYLLSLADIALLANGSPTMDTSEKT